MKYFTMFSGIGGAELGIEQAHENHIHRLTGESEERNGTPKSSQQSSQATPKSIQRSGYKSDSLSRGNTRTLQCIGFSEIDKYAINIYQKHYPKHKNYGDATRINASELPDFDLLVGGFPCQAFSIAGKRLGFNETRGTLFFDIARILKEKRPRNFVLENVKGLLSHDNGRTFKTIITTLAELGYCVEWQVLNSKNFGVPQNRERVYIVGHLGGEPERKVFPILGSNEQNLEAGSHDEQGPQAQRVYSENGISPTLDIGAGGNRQPKIAIPVLTPDRLEKRQNGRRFKEHDDPSFTLTAQDKHGVYDGIKIRRLTPVECERLQGFPDGWTDIVSDTQRYKTLGNAMTVNVVQAVVERLL